MEQQKSKSVRVSLETMIQEKIRISDYLDQIENYLIAQALEKFQGNQTHAADALGINRTTFVMKHRRLKQLGSLSPIEEVRNNFKHLFQKS